MQTFDSQIDELQETIKSMAIDIQGLRERIIKIERKIAKEYLLSGQTTLKT